MSKIDLKKLEAGKRYRLVIEADTNMNPITNLPSIEFVVPEAAPLAKSIKPAIQKVSYTSAGKTKSRLWITIPESVMSNLIWKDDVRDVVHVVYRSAADSESLPSTVKYLSNDASVSFSTVPSPPSFSTGSFQYGHPNAFSKNVEDNLFYSFQFVIARYVNTSADWTTYNKYWLNPGKNIKDILSQQSTWGS